MTNPHAHGLGPVGRCKLPIGLFLGYPEFMTKSIRDIPKKRRGRPKTTGRGEGVLVRLQADQLEALDVWIQTQKEPGLSRPEAVRRILSKALR
jgi:hypothetical protein